MQRSASVAGVADQLGVVQHAQQLEAGPDAGLAGAQHVALAPLLEVDLGEREAVAGGGDRVQPLPGHGLLVGAW